MAEKTCANCKGKGRCPKCNGRGYTVGMFGGKNRCPQCDGHCKCTVCKGAGKVKV